MLLAIAKEVESSEKLANDFLAGALGKAGLLSGAHKIHRRTKISAKRATVS